MSRGKNLQEMETGTTQSRTAVNANARAAEAPGKSATPVGTPGQTGSWEDLGGPTPENYKTDDDSAKLKTPGATLKQVRDIVNAKAKSAEQMKSMKEEEEDELEDDEDFLYEEEEKEDEDEDEDEDGDSKKKSKKKDEDEDDDEEESGMKEQYDIEEDVNALLGGEDLSEEFKEKAKIIFESAINSKIAEIQESMEAHYENQLLEEVEEIKSELIERVDSYLEYVADEWIQENALAIENGIKTEMTESFLSGMRNLFEEHYVTIPEDKYDVLESMVDKLDEMETKLNEQISRNIALNQKLAESVADVIFSEISEGLAFSQKDKLASLAESVEFGSEREYREKLVTLREAYFPKNSSTQRDHSEILTEDSSDIYEPVSGVMESYLQTLDRVSKK